MLLDSTDLIRTELEFTLPCGYVDEQGELHRMGAMRLARAMDEVQPLADNRVQTNAAYVSILVLSRVLTNLGSIRPVPVHVVEQLFASDFAYLQDLYMRLNAPQGLLAETCCPSCGEQFEVDLAS